MADKDYVPVLKEVFSELNDQVIEELYNQSRVVEYPDETVLCHQGAREATFYVILEGQADVFKNIEGQAHFIAPLHMGQYFGEMALILDKPRTADVIASGRIKVLEIDRVMFKKHLLTNPEILDSLAGLVMDRLRDHEELLHNQLAELRREQEETPRRVFVSYVREDGDLVERVADDLLEQGIDVWLDKLHIKPGAGWARAIGEALEDCSAMLLFLSSNSLASTNVEDEWNYYLDEEKPIVPVLVEECKIPFRLRRIQYVDILGLDYQTALTRIVSALRYYQ
jgi:CRP-like cAMP-binding protein